MPLSKIPLIATLLLAFIFGANGQERLTASEQIDEFQNPQCEDLWALLDNLYVQMTLEYWLVLR